MNNEIEIVEKAIKAERSRWFSWTKDERGATAVEYALIVGLIAALIATATTNLKDSVNTALCKAKNSISNTTGTC